MDPRNSLVVILLFFGFSFHVKAQKVDESFTPLISGYARISASAVDHDGRIIVAGNINKTNDEVANGIIRLKNDGTIDSSFNPMFLSYHDHVSSILIDNNGKILIVVGGLNGSNVIRLLPNGNHDDTFTIDSSVAVGRKIACTSEDKYILQTSSLPAIVRLNSDGSLDDTFDVAGNNEYLNINAIAIQADDKIIIGGTFDQYKGQQLKNLLRLNADGSIDNSFSIGTGFSSAEGTSTVNSVSIDPTGDIVVAGSFSSFNGVACLNLVRLKSDGGIKEGFILYGPTANVFSSPLTACSFQDGILVSGLAISGMDISYRLMKLNADGSQDATFSIRSFTVFNEAGSVNDPIISLINSDTIVFTGLYHLAENHPKPGIALIDSTGNLIEFFNPVFGGDAVVESVVKQNDGKLLIGGSIEQIGTHRVSKIARLNKDGSIDQSFQENVGDGPSRNVNCIAVQPDNKIIVGGAFESYSGSAEQLLVRLNADGTLDNSFNANLIQKYVGPGVNDVQILSDGKILVGGTFYAGDGSVHNFVRLNADGSLDDNFNHGVLDNDHVINSICVMSTGEIVIGGENFPNGGGLLMKLDADGNLIDAYPSLSLYNHSISVIRALPNDEFLFAGDFSRFFSTTEPNPVFIVKSNNVVDSVSIAVKGGSINDVIVTWSSTAIIVGDFRQVNGADFEDVATVSLNGSIDHNYKLPADGYYNKVIGIREENDTLIFVGSFRSVKNTAALSIVKATPSPLEQPDNLSASIDYIKGSIDLTWEDNAAAEHGFQILRSDNENQEFIAIDSVDSNTTTFSDLNIAVNTYSYKVRAFNQIGSSPYSNTVSQAVSVPAAPGAFSVGYSASFMKVTLTWVDESTNETGFEIERLTGSGFILISTTEIDATSYTDPDFDFGVRNTYRVRSFNKFGKSQYADAIQSPIILSSENNDARFNIFPNPAIDVFHVQNLSADYSTISIYDLRENLVYQETCSKSTDIMVSGFSSGLYLVRIIDGKQQSTIKLVKQ